MTGLDVSAYPGAVGDGVQPVHAVLRFEKNTRGRDFVVGDVHGMFSALNRLLDAIGFDEDVDRLFCVGDLVDRGPESRDALDWLRHPWFFSCRGNHEQFALESLDDEQLKLWVNHNGGDWWLGLTPAEQAVFREVFAELPLAMEIETESGLVGIVHADTPPLLRWERFMELLREGDKEALFYAIWSRNRISGQFTSAVDGNMERIYCGHTPTKSTVLVGNVYYIDTGAVYCYEGYKDARLTAVEIHPRRHVTFEENTA